MSGEMTKLFRLKRARVTKVVRSVSEAPVPLKAVVAQWFLRDSQWYVKAGAGGCDWRCVWPVLLCGLCFLCCFYGLDYATSMLLYACFYGLDYVVLLWSELCVCLCLIL
jgi:hypothetical protein